MIENIVFRLVAAFYIYFFCLFTLGLRLGSKCNGMKPNILAHVGAPRRKRNWRGRSARRTADLYPDRAGTILAQQLKEMTAVRQAETERRLLSSVIAIDFFSWAQAKQHSPETEKRSKERGARRWVVRGGVPLGSVPGCSQCATEIRRQTSSWGKKMVWDIRKISLFFFFWCTQENRCNAINLTNNRNYIIVGSQELPPKNGCAWF